MNEVPADPAPLRLEVLDSADLEVASALLQDALVPVTDIAWFAGEHRFVFAVNRFRWEGDGDAQTRERVLAGVSFENVTTVHRRDIARHDDDGFLALLAIALLDDSGDDSAVVEITFANSTSARPAIRLETTRLVCHIEDFGEPWPTQWRPSHGND